MGGNQLRATKTGAVSIPVCLPGLHGAVDDSLPGRRLVSEKFDPHARPVSFPVAAP
jgi:hypothetical protein